MILAGQGPAYDEIAELTPNWEHVGTGPLRPGRLLCSVQYPRIVTAEQLADYEHAVNLHYGILPEYRGCFPTKWAVINNEPAGVTLHHMTPRIDAGNILDMRSFPTVELTDQVVYRVCNLIAVRMFKVWRARFESGSLPPGTPQDEGRARYYPKQLPYGGKRISGWTPEFLERVERAFTHEGYPGLA